MCSEFLPRRYQDDCLDILNELLRKKKNRALVVMATGSGKTIIAAFFTQIFQKKCSRQARILFLCDQGHLLFQACKKFETILGDHYHFGYFTGRQKSQNVDILFATFQSMSRWKETFHKDTFDLIIIDEGHHTYAETYLPIVAYFTPQFLLGLTPTPDRADLKDIRDIFGKEVFCLVLEEAIVRKIVCPIDYRLMNVSLDFSNLPKALVLDELDRLLFRNQTPFEIVRIVQEKITSITRPKVLVFVPSITEADFFAEVFPNAIALHGQTTRFENELVRFCKGDYTYATTVDKLSEGVDIPEINVLVFLRSTNSYGLFSQQLGRGLRKIEGKEKVLVLDFVGNCHRIEMVNQLLLQVKEQQRALSKKKNSSSVPTEDLIQLTVNEGEVSFTETIMSIRTILRRTLGVVTKETLIAEIRELALELGRTPTYMDIELARKEGKTRSIATYVKYFNGSFVELLKAANLPVNRLYTTETPSPDSLIAELHWFYKTYGHAPTNPELGTMSKQGYMHSVSTYKKVFGDFPSALLAAQLPLPRVLWRPRPTKEILIAELRSFFQEKGYSPSYRDVAHESSKGNMYSLTTYVKFFGNLNKGLSEASLPPSGQS